MEFQIGNFISVPSQNACDAKKEEIVILNPGPLPQNEIMISLIPSTA
jgi:hypothetical protein